MPSLYGNEYNNNVVSSSACNYNSLGCYLGANSTMPPVKAGQTSGVYLTPNYSAIGYNALTHGTPPGCQQYFSITDAYGKGAGSCNTSYTRRLCGGCNGGGGGGQSSGWKCNTNTGKCQAGGRLGERGVFGSAYQCQQNCHTL